MRNTNLKSKVEVKVYKDLKKYIVKQDFKQVENK